ncbi:hypothetical protein PYW08_012728 [Mythimna loreyi]|uniref:Uncharacterized protein n=1 Tax=Mythimna loreyi TaxID=667449 RepID=A0ACC2Q1V7_9NEOP|nr:hypothetical protein PYW08_012728 [Mythimna loreyi]
MEKLDEPEDVKNEPLPLKSEPIEVENAVASTLATPFAQPIFAAFKSKAQKQREYRQRLAASRTPAEAAAARKSKNERQRKNRLRQAANLAIASGSLQATTASSSRSTIPVLMEVQATPFAEPITAAPKTRAQIQREYRQRMAVSRTPAQAAAAREARNARERYNRLRQAATLPIVSGSLQATTTSSSRSGQRLNTVHVDTQRQFTDQQRQILATEPAETTVQPSTSSDQIEVQAQSTWNTKWASSVMRFKSTVLDNDFGYAGSVGDRLWFRNDLKPITAEQLKEGISSKETKQLKENNAETKREMSKERSRRFRERKRLDMLKYVQLVVQDEVPGPSFDNPPPLVPINRGTTNPGSQIAGIPTNISRPLFLRAIWNTKCEEYSDRVEKMKQWEEVVNLFVDHHASVEEKRKYGKLLQKRWRTLRDAFVKQRRELANTNNECGAMNKKYKYYDQLLFLSPIVSINTTQNFMPSQEFDTESQNYINIAVPGPSDLNHTNIIPKRIKIKSDTTDTVLKDLAKVLKSFLYRRTDEEDSILQFMLSMVDDFKRVPQKLQSRLKINVLKCVLEARDEDEVSGGSKSKEKENEIKLFCPKCKTEVSHTAEGIQADQTKIIVAKVYNYLEQEYEELKKTFEGIDQTPLSKIRQRTALATGVSETMVEEILQEEARRHEELHQETLLEESRARKRQRQTENLMEEGSSDENEADDEDKNEDEDIADDDDQIETLVIKEEPIEPYNEEPEAYVELPAVKQEPGEFGVNQEVAQPVSVCLKTEPQDEEEATASTETTAVQHASKSKKRRTTKRNTDVPPAATISPATSVLPGTSTPGSSAIPGTSAPPERRLILLEDGEVKMEQIEIGEEGFS